MGKSFLGGTFGNFPTPNIRGPWTVGTLYVAEDLVSHDGRYYKNIGGNWAWGPESSYHDVLYDHIAGQVYWPGSGGGGSNEPNSEDEPSVWVAGTYAVGDIVKRQSFPSTYWRCRTAVTDTLPDKVPGYVISGVVSFTYWEPWHWWGEQWEDVTDWWTTDDLYYSIGGSTKSQVYFTPSKSQGRERNSNSVKLGPFPEGSQVKFRKLFVEVENYSIDTDATLTFQLDGVDTDLSVTLAAGDNFGSGKQYLNTVDEVSFPANESREAVFKLTRGDFGELVISSIWCEVELTGTDRCIRVYSSGMSAADLFYAVYTFEYPIVGSGNFSNTDYGDPEHPEWQAAPYFPVARHHLKYDGTLLLFRVGTEGSSIVTDDVNISLAKFGEGNVATIVFPQDAEAGDVYDYTTPLALSTGDELSFIVQTDGSGHSNFAYTHLVVLTDSTNYDVTTVFYNYNWAYLISYDNARNRYTAYSDSENEYNDLEVNNLTFDIGPGYAWEYDDVRAYDAADPSKYMLGSVQSYDPDTGILEMQSYATGSSGTTNDNWVLRKTEPAYLASYAYGYCGSFDTYPLPWNSASPMTVEIPLGCRVDSRYVISGETYIVTEVGDPYNTNWESIGAGSASPAVGTQFTATADGLDLIEIFHGSGHRGEVFYPSFSKHWGQHGGFPIHSRISLNWQVPGLVAYGIVTGNTDDVLTVSLDKWDYPDTSYSWFEHATSSTTQTLPLTVGTNYTFSVTNTTPELVQDEYPRFEVGDFVRFWDASDSTQYVEGIVQSYTVTTPANRTPPITISSQKEIADLVLNVGRTVGTGAISSWSVSYNYPMNVFDVGVQTQYVKEFKERYFEGTHTYSDSPTSTIEFISEPIINYDEWYNKWRTGVRVRMADPLNRSNYMEGTVIADKVEIATSGNTVHDKILKRNTVLIAPDFKTTTGDNSSWVINPCRDFNATSTDLVTVGVGVKSFYIGTGYSYYPGVRVRASCATDKTLFVEGAVVSYGTHTSGGTFVSNSANNGILRIQVDTIESEGSCSDWKFYVNDRATSSIGSIGQLKTLWPGASRDDGKIYGALPILFDCSISFSRLSFAAFGGSNDKPWSAKVMVGTLDGSLGDQATKMFGEVDTPESITNWWDATGFADDDSVEILNLTAGQCVWIELCPKYLEDVLNSDGTSSEFITVLSSLLFGPPTGGPPTPSGAFILFSVC